jgi:hypothetical protein
MIIKSLITTIIAGPTAYNASQTINTNKKVHEIENKHLIEQYTKVMYVQNVAKAADKLSTESKNEIKAVLASSVPLDVLANKLSETTKNIKAKSDVTNKDIHRQTAQLNTNIQQTAIKIAATHQQLNKATEEIKDVKLSQAKADQALGIISADSANGSSQAAVAAALVGAVAVYATRTDQQSVTNEEQNVTPNISVRPVEVKPAATSRPLAPKN